MNLAIKTLPATAGFRRLITRWIRRHPSQAGTVSVTITPDTSGVYTAMERLDAALRPAAELLYLQHREAEHISAYDESIRHQRYLGRMHVLELADDAWARYGWVRPKVGPPMMLSVDVTEWVKRHVTGVALDPWQQKVLSRIYDGPATLRLRRIKRHSTDPAPLCIDGHAYHRRTRNRRGRR